MIPKRGSYINAIYVPVFLFFLSYIISWLFGIFFNSDFFFMHHIQIEINEQLTGYALVLSFQSLDKARRFIVTHYPTPEDAVDFLRLLNDHESDTVICMDPIHQVESVRKTLLMLYVNKNQTVKYFYIIFDSILFSLFHFTTLYN